MLQACVDSVLNQTDQDFELILVDDCSTDRETIKMLRQYESSEKIRVITRKKQGGIVAATNDGIAAAQGTYVGFLDHDDELSLHAIQAMKNATQINKNADFLYSDENLIYPDGTHGSPFYKPDWSPERLRSQNYICHFSIVRKTLLDAVGGLRDGFEGSQDYDLALRCSEATNEIVHVREILYHWRMHSESTSSGLDVKGYAYDSAKKALKEHVERLGWDAAVERVRPEGVYEVRRTNTDNPLVSIIIPSAFSRKLVRGRKLFLLENAIRSSNENSTYENVEYIVVTNVSSTEQDRKAVLDAAPGKVRIVEKPGPFNFSAQVNYASTFARGELFLMLNDDTEIVEPDSIERMVGFFIEKDIGIVGSLLLFETDTVQHAGIVMAQSGPTNYLTGFTRSEENYSLSLFCSREVSATTFAIALVDRDLFFKVGGLCEGLPNCFNDVDICCKVLEAGKRIIWTPQSVFYHYESASRDPEVKHFEIQKMVHRWKQNMVRDPYTHPRLALIRHTLVPIDDPTYEDPDRLVIHY